MSAVFDTLEYVKGAEKVHIPREQAEYQAQQLAALIHNDVASKHDLKQLESSLKNYVKSEIKECKSDILKWMFGVSISQLLILIGIVEFFIKH